MVSALARGVPVISARQMLAVARRTEWIIVREPGMGREPTDVRNPVGAGADGLRAMVPSTTPTGPLTGVQRDGIAVSHTLETIKGIEVRGLRRATGVYQVTYGVDDAAAHLGRLGDARRGHDDDLLGHQRGEHLAC